MVRFISLAAKGSLTLTRSGPRSPFDTQPAVHSGLDVAPVRLLLPPLSQHPCRQVAAGHLVAVVVETLGSRDCFKIRRYCEVYLRSSKLLMGQNQGF